MSHLVDTSKHFGNARQPLSSSGAAATQRSAVGESHGGVPWRVVLALVLILIAGLLFWRLNPWHSSAEAKRRGDSAFSRQPLRAANEALPNPHGVPSERAVAERRPKPEGRTLVLDDLHQPFMPHSRNALRNHISADQPPDVEYEPPSEQRARAILENVTEPVPSPSILEEQGGAPANVPKTRSQARSIALADVAARMPAAYNEREIRSEEAVPGAELPNSSKSSVAFGSSRKQPQAASKAHPDKTPDSAEPVAYKELPSQIQSAIPLSISMSIYTRDAAERRITINGSTVREGEEVSPGLRLETIGPDGAIFSYHGYRFHKAVRGD